MARHDEDGGFLTSEELVEQKQKQAAIFDKYKDHKYDPDEQIRKVSIMQNVLLDAISEQNVFEIVKSPKSLEQVVGLLTSMQTGALQSKRLVIDETDSKNAGLIADAILEQMGKHGREFIEVREGAGDIPSPSIDHIETEAFNEQMLERGLQTQTYDDFVERTGAFQDKEEG